jgi:hypothetical protein
VRRCAHRHACSHLPACKHTIARTAKHARTHTHAHACAPQPHTHTHAHAHAHAHTHGCAPQAHALTRARTHARMCARHRWEPSAGSLPWNALEAFNGIDELIDRGHDFQVGREHSGWVCAAYYDYPYRYSHR